MRGAANMTDAMRAHLEGVGVKGRDRIRRDSVKMLRAAWTNRHDSYRAPMVIRSNVQMLRNLREF